MVCWSVSEMSTDQCPVSVYSDLTTEMPKLFIGGPLWRESNRDRWVCFPHKGTEMRKMFPFHDIIISSNAIVMKKSQVKGKSKIFYYNKIIIHRMTQRLKPIWIYLSHKFLPLFTLQRPHFDDNSVSTGASTGAVRSKKLRHSRHKLHWNRSTDSSATSDGKTDTTMAAPLQWTTMMPNIEV